MWLMFYAPILTLAVAATGAEAEPSGDKALPQPISSRQTYFSIPFQVDQPSLPASRAAEVQLHVSTDRGETWSQYASVPPEQDRFLFRAQRDGEYWFGVRTLDRSNQLRPAEIHRPGLIVIVDTSPPKLSLQAQHCESGLATARWQVAEQRLDRNSLTILYRSGPNLPWLTVATDREEDDLAKSAWSGDVSWMPVSGPGPLEVRAEIADTAGNRDISYTQVTYDRNLGTLAASASASAPSARDVSTTDTQYTHDRPAAAQGPVSTLDDQPTSEDSLDGWRAAAKVPPSDVYGGTPSRHGESDSSMSNPVEYGTFSPDQSMARVPPSDIYGGNPTRHDESDSSMSNPVEYGRFSPDQSIVAKSSPPIRDEFTTYRESSAPLGRHDDSLPQPRSRMVNSRLFNLGYDLDAADSANPARVELWGTRDEGRTWRSYGVDEDGRSPIMATVEAEGTYGFRIVVSSGRDPVGQSPRPGDPADMLVTVDLTDPVARVLSAEQATHSPDGQITVRWEAADARLAQRPISLYRAIYPGGPWDPVAQDLENSGRYEWFPQRNLPDRIYLRLEVRDEAGNVGTSKTTEPIVLTDRRPATNVIRRNDESARLLPKRYYWR